MFQDPQSKHYHQHADVMRKCERIYKGLMIRSRDNTPADYSMTIRNDENAVVIVKFMSTQPFSGNSIPQTIIDHVDDEHRNDSVIFGFCSEINIQNTVNELTRRWNVPYSKTPNKKVTLYLYSNMNKYDYTDTSTITQITLRSNYHPDVRTNCDNLLEEHALYAICPHGSAATAALHHIAKYERDPNTNDDDPKNPPPQYIRSTEIKKNVETKIPATSTKISTTMEITHVTEFHQYSDIGSYKQSCIVRPFDQLVIPFLPMKVNIPLSNHSHFYELYNIEDSSKLAGKFEFQDSSTLSYHIDQDYEILFDDAIHSQMNWSILYREFGNENYSVELIQTIFDMTLDSLQRYDVYPTLFALLRTTSKREMLIESLDLRHRDILVPIKKIDNGSKLLVCTQIQRFPLTIQKLKFPVTNRLSFDIAHILWINVNQGKPFENPHFELNNTIVLYHMNKLQEIAERFEQSIDDVWGYFIMLTICEAGNKTWNSITVNEWCDFLHNALPNDERIDKFENFLLSHMLWETFQLTLKDDSTGKLGNDEQLNVIKKRKAYKIQQRLLSNTDKLSK
jgi:hypothetical protein